VYGKHLKKHIAKEREKMTKQPKILAFAGSLRKESFNKKLVKIAIKGAQEAGAEVTYIDLKDYPLPIYDGDIENEQGLPENALKLKDLMLSNDGFLISCPEYNSSMSAVFKNTIDWVSRPASPDEVYLSCFIDKVVALMSASPSNFGGMRGLVHIRAMFGNINSIVIPQQKCISLADSAFGADGNLKDAKQQQDVIKLGARLVDFIRKFKGYN
jgi:chromate reductase, NAD(P)H dehydrogenase (quinone)